MPLNEEAFITRVSLRHSVSPDAVRTILRALRAGGGTMAQFRDRDISGRSFRLSRATRVRLNITVPGSPGSGRCHISPSRFRIDRKFRTRAGAIARSLLGPACVKTRASGECAELFSPFSSFDCDCQCGSFPIQRNRDKSSTRKFDVGVFTQAASTSISRSSRNATSASILGCSTRPAATGSSSATSMSSQS
jgi:hypothetical protein